MLENVHEATIKSLPSLEDCVLQVDYGRGRPLDRIISLGSKLSTPQTFVHKESVCSKLISKNWHYGNAMICYVMIFDFRREFEQICFGDFKSMGK